MKIAELVIIPRPPEAVAYHVYARVPDSLTAPPRLVYNTRGYDTPEGHAGARGRVERWATANGYRVIERKEERRKRA